MRMCTKMDLPKTLLLCLMAVILSLSLCSCGGTFRSHPGEGDVSGVWNLALTRSDGTVRELQLFIVQEHRYEDFSGTTSDNAALTGTLNGNNISITLDNSDKSATTMAAALSDDWKSMHDGTYSSTGPDGSGTWSATRPAPALSVTPKSATLSCSQGQSATFHVAGGTRSKYTVVASKNGSLVTLSTTDLATDGQFTVTANTSCTGSDGDVASLVVSDTATSITVSVTISKP